jgi:hypothetical protein
MGFVTEGKLRRRALGSALGALSLGGICDA